MFATDIQHAGHLTHALMQLGIKTAVVHGQNPHRKAKINAFKTGRLQVVVNVNIASYGFDVPEAEVCALVYATSSGVRFTQNVGRIMRATAGKAFGRVLDFGGNYERGMCIGQDFEFQVDDLPLAPGAKRKTKRVNVPDITTSGREGGPNLQLRTSQHDVWSRRCGHGKREVPTTSSTRS